MRVISFLDEWRWRDLSRGRVSLVMICLVSEKGGGLRFVSGGEWRGLDILGFYYETQFAMRFGGEVRQWS